MENCNQSHKIVSKVHKGLQSSLVSLAWSWSGRPPLRGTRWYAGTPDSDPCGQAPVLLPPNIPLCLFPLDGGREWEMVALVVDAECDIRCLKDPQRSALSCPVSPLPLGLSRVCLPFPSFTSPPSTCGNCPFPLASGCFFKFIWFHFGPFMNDPPAPEIYLVNLLLAGLSSKFRRTQYLSQDAQVWNSTRSTWQERGLWLLV